MTTLEQAEAKAKEIIDSYNDFCQKTYGVSLTSNRWASTPSGQQLIQSLVSEGATSMLGKKVKVDYPFPLNDEVFDIIGERKDEVEIAGDFSAGTHNVCQSEWVLKSKIKEYANT